MSTELAPTGPEIDQEAILKAIGIDVRDPNAQALLLTCRRYELDPILRHMVLIQGRPYITRDGLLHVAHRSKQLDGIEVMDQGETPTHFVAKVAVYRKDMGRRFAYVGRYPKDGHQRKFGPEMAVKCAEVMALRRAFDVAACAVEELWDREMPDGEPEARPLPKEPDESEPDAARLREKRKAQRDIARPYGEFATDAVKEARDVFYAKCIRNTIAVPPEEVKELPNVHQLGWHLTKWLAGRGWAEMPPEGTQTSDNNRALSKAWQDSTPRVRATMRLEARRYLAEKFGEVYGRLAGHGEAYEAPAEATATGGA